MTTLIAEASLPADWYDGASQVLFLFRVIIGVTLAAHGYNKFFGGGKIAGTARWFDSMGMKPNGTVHAYLAASTEIGSGVLMALGLLTPLAGAGFVGLMVVAAWTVNKSNGFFTMNHGWEFNLVLAASAVTVATLGPGKQSLDWALGFDWAFTPNTGFFISAVLGAAAGIGLMVTCWRPPAKDDA
jgi:putative oxidoreductase